MNICLSKDIMIFISKLKCRIKATNSSRQKVAVGARDGSVDQSTDCSFE